jgi:hypothetical protein
MPKLIDDTFSQEWLIVKEYCEDQIEELRAYNDDDHSDIETANIRGQIKFAKNILSLSDDPQQSMIDDQDIPDETYIS